MNSKMNDLGIDFENEIEKFWKENGGISGITQDNFFKPATRLVDIKDLIPLMKRLATAENYIRQIHQKLKRGEYTEDHGVEGNFNCIMDHLSSDIAVDNLFK